MAIQDLAPRVESIAQSRALLDLFELLGRVLLATLFLMFGLEKLETYGIIAAYLTAHQVPPELLPLVIGMEVLGALAIILGWNTRTVAFLMCGYALLTALLFHRNLEQPVEAIMFFKNVAIAAGFLLLAVHGAGRLSLDQRHSEAEYHR